MQINILFFATIRNLIGQKHLSLELDDSNNTIEHLRKELINRYPDVTDNINIALTAINEEFAFNSDSIKDGDEVAFFPPVSGGSGESSDPPEIFLLPTESVNHDDIVASITTSKTGAVCLFSGMVRGKTNKDGHIPDTEYLEYEAYEPMALAKMKQVAQEIRQQWHKVEGIAIAQRIGRLEVGQNTVLIACSSPHRDDGCFEAARYGIDRLKEIVPVWKKEIGADGEAWIEGEYVPTDNDKWV